MSDKTYNEQRARTRAADAVHAAMMDWYAEQLGVKRSELHVALVKLSSDRAKQLYQQYQEQL